MPYNPALDDKIQMIVATWSNVVRKNMFGGTGYLLNGNMVTGVYRDLLVLRVGQEMEEELLANDWCRPMDLTGKSMKGWLFVTEEGWDNEQRLEDLVNAAKAFVGVMPPK